jgi:adenine-specific DNA-methyltransferase
METDCYLFNQYDENIHVEPETAERQLQWLCGLTILDLSCGGGIFLRCVLKKIMQISRNIHMAARIPFDAADVAACVLSQLTGVDKQSDALLLSELLIRIELFHLLKHEAGVPASFNLNLFCADALSWKETRQQNGYQIILGNPPYVGEKGNRVIFDLARQSDFGLKHYEKNMDLAYYFLYRGIELLASDGCLCYVMTSYFATADGAGKLRNKLRSSTHFHWLVHPDNVTLFPHAKGQHNLIFCLGKNTEPAATAKLLHTQIPMNRSELLRRLSENGIDGFGRGAALTHFENPSDLYDYRGQLLIRSCGTSRKMTDILEKKANFQLQDLCSISQGLVSGADKVTPKHQLILDKYVQGQGIFVLSNSEKKKLINDEPELSAFIKPFYKNSHIRPYYTAANSDQWLLYLTDENLPDISLFPELAVHLEPFKPVLAKRREVRNDTRKWHSLHWPRSPALFEATKIVAPQRASLNIFALVDRPWYASADVYYIHHRESCSFSIEYIQAWLNSALCFGWLNLYGKMKGKDLELYATPLKHIPVPEPPDQSEEDWVVDCASHLTNPQLSLSDRMKAYRCIDLRLLEWHGLSYRKAETLIEKVDSLRLNFNRRNI